ncbi:bacillithiol system redox-active protein YtxJ [Salinicoccus roseus]|uniref:Bacillithiol system protein YtxJ n=1 Tax=Salinicoccus roseus TaxID=45670 RepID=A0A0C2DNR6_9STAP|nr:bacillithiol system redox-active protein YtxJ [Salinicoccus roseus]KIH71653.1 bacillithiol system protein YtxJ [Salinicoccus roseus]MDB0579752.1 bacillithiol system redox-active protein YtxJ [Salinicoccus roseus]
MLTKTTSVEAFQKLLQDNKDFFFMKHSSTCPISADAFDEFQKFHYERDMDGYYLVVQDHRNLSNYIAEHFDIKHESPQAFYFEGGKLKWSGAHHNITLKNLSSVED